MKRLLILVTMLAVAVAAIAGPAHAADPPVYQYTPVTTMHFVGDVSHPEVGVPITIVDATYADPVWDHIQHYWNSETQEAMVEADTCPDPFDPDHPYRLCSHWDQALTYTPTAADVGGVINVVATASTHEHPYVFDTEQLFTGIVSDHTGDWVTDVQLQTQQFGAEDWVDADADHPVTAGNPTRLTYDVHNPTGTAGSVGLVVHDEAGNPVNGSSTTLTLPAHSGHQTMTVPLDTWNMAYVDGNPKPSWTYNIAALPSSAPTETDTVDIAVRPRPVVLAHGYNSTAAAWDQFKTLLQDTDPRLNGYAVGDGQFPGTENTGSLTAPGRLTNTIHQNAGQLATYLAAVRTATGARHVDIVAHSMGGLISRDYIQTLMPTSSDTHPVVGHLVQMGTPNAGSPCADMMVAASIGHPRAVPEPATLELTTAYAAGFNRTVTDLRGVELSNLVGTNIPLPCGFLTLSDGVVPESSARWTIPVGDLFFKTLAHTSMTGDQDVVDHYVIPRLSDAPGTGVATLADLTATATTAPLDAGSEDEHPGIFDTRTISVAPGKRTGFTFAAPQGIAMGASLVGAGAALELLGPNGKVISRADAPLADMPFTGVTLGNPDPGTYTLRVTNTATTALRAIPVALWVEQSPFGVAVSVSGRKAGRLHVTAVTAGAGTGASVQAVVTDSRTTRATVSLFDDGAHGDGMAGDGVFGADLTGLPRTGALVVAAIFTVGTARMTATTVA